MADNQQDKPQEHKPPEDKAQEEKPKIIVDDDWKAQARAEKEKLDEEVKARQEAEGAPGEAAGPGGGRIPPASFATLVNSLGAQALLALGGYEDRKTKRRLVDLDLAKHHIDSLVVLEEKTKGNLTDEERQLLDNVLYEARMQFVQFAQRLSVAPASSARRQPPKRGQG